MKIVDVCEFYSETGGGVRSYVDRKLDVAAEHGHALTVIAPGATSRVEQRRGGKIIWVEAPSLPFDKNYRMYWSASDVWRVLDAEAPDVVEGSSPWRGGWIAGHWSGRAAKAFVFHQDAVAVYPSTFLDQKLPHAKIDRLFGWYWNYLKRLSARYDATVTGGEWLAQRLARFGIHNPVAVPFGVEAGRFSPNFRDESLRQELLARCCVPPDAALLFTVSRFHPEKRLGTITSAFARAKASRPIGLVIVGDGLARKHVERAAAAAGNVYLAGAIRDRDMLAKLYASADALLHGSGAETYGLVVAEAISSGLPVIVPDTGGAADLASRAPSRLYKTGNVESCAATILEFLAAPRDPVPVPPLRSLDEHFADLFALYGQLARKKSSGG